MERRWSCRPATGPTSAVRSATGRSPARPSRRTGIPLRLWSHDLATDSGAKAPMWGFSGSPLVVGKVVIVFAGGESSHNLFAYRIDSGDLAWMAEVGTLSYSSPHRAVFDGTEQVLMFTNR